MKRIQVARRKPITKQLEDKYGGKWRNIPFQGIWKCEEKNMDAVKYQPTGYDINGDIICNKFILVNSLVVYKNNVKIDEFYVHN